MAKGMILGCPDCVWQSRVELRDDYGNYSLMQYLDHRRREHTPQPKVKMVDLVDETVGP